MKSRWMVCAFALVLGCSEGQGMAGDGGGAGGAAANGGQGGVGGRDPCAQCKENECLECERTERRYTDGSIICDSAPVDDGTECGDGAGTCQLGSCVGTFACTEQGIRDAVGVRGGPHTFDCDGPTTVVTQAEIVVDNVVRLDGEGNLTVDGGGGHTVFAIELGASATLNGLTVIGGTASSGGAGVVARGHLYMTGSAVSGNAGDGILATAAGGGSYLYLTESAVFENGGSGIRSEESHLIAVNNSTISGNGDCAIDGQGWGLVVSTSTIVGSLCCADCVPSMHSFEPFVTCTLVVGSCASRIGGDNNIELPGNTCGFGDSSQVNVNAEDLKLGPLADNGGPTRTHALGEGSVAIDAGDPEHCSLLEFFQPCFFGCPHTTDQRGEPRPAVPDTMADIGAFEVQP